MGGMAAVTPTLHRAPAPAAARALSTLRAPRNAHLVAPHRPTLVRAEPRDGPAERDEAAGAGVSVSVSDEGRAEELSTTRESLEGALAADDEGGWLAGLPARYKVVGVTSLAFVIGNMDKVNMSVAIIPMAQDLGWSPSVAGVVQSSFFCGYVLCQLPGGYLSSKFSGRKVLSAGVTLWSLATASVPSLTATIPSLCVARAGVGLGEGFAPAAATDMVARVVPKEERSRAVSVVFGGLHVGSVVGLLASPLLIANFGWQSVFYFSGVAGAAWFTAWELLMRDLKANEPEVIEALTDVGKSADGGDKAGDEAMPWRALLAATPVRALMYTHFCYSWFNYSVLAWLPSYFKDTLSLDLASAAQISLLPPIAGIVMSAVAGPTADALTGRGVATATVRKGCQAAAFLGPSALMAALMAAGDGADAPLTIGLLTTALGLTSFSLGGLYSNHQDLSPKYASILLALTNTAGALPGIIGVATTGFLLDKTGSWDLALFVPSMAFFLTGTVVYTALGSSDPIDFDAEQAALKAADSA